jgi:hypothetical protein
LSFGFWFWDLSLGFGFGFWFWVLVLGFGLRIIFIPTFHKYFGSFGKGINKIEIKTQYKTQQQKQ